MKKVYNEISLKSLNKAIYISEQVCIGWHN